MKKILAALIILALMLPVCAAAQTQSATAKGFGGDITVTDSVLTATGGLSIRTVGLYNGGTVTLNGLNSRLTATADEYYEDAPGVSSEVYCYGAMNGDGYNPGGAYTVNGGILLLQGQTSAINDTTKTLTAPPSSAVQTGMAPMREM